MPHRDHLQSEAQTAVIPAPQRNQPPVLVIQVEEPFKLHPRQRTELAIAGRTLTDHDDMIDHGPNRPVTRP